LIFLNIFWGVPALLGLAALHVGLPDASLLYGIWEDLVACKVLPQARGTIAAPGKHISETRVRIFTFFDDAALLLY
jgi:hypothetical protein